MCLPFVLCGLFGLDFLELLFLQHAVGHLPHQGLGHILLEVDVIGHGVLGDVLAAVVHDHLLGLLRGLEAGGQLHEGLDLLHLVGIRHADDAAHLHGGVGVQDVLQLAGIDVVAGGDDHPLGAAPEEDETLIVHDAEIPGIDPGQPVCVVPQGLGGLLGVLHVLLHHRGTGQQDLALLTVRQLLVGAGLDDLDVGVREREADAPLLEHVRRGQAAGGDGLGGAVALPHLDGGVVVVEELVELLFQLHGEAVAAGEHALQAAEIGLLHAVQPEQRLIQRGHAGDEVAFVLGDLLGVALGGESGDQDAAAALAEHGVDAHAQTEAVEQRHGSQHLVAGAEDGVRRHHLLAQSVEVLVGEHDALGGAGGAAGIEDHGGVLALALHGVLVEAGLAQIQEFLPADHGRVLGDLLDLSALSEHIARPDGLREGVLDAGDDDVHHLGVGADALELVVELVQRDGRDGLGLVEIELDLLLRRQRVDHVGDGAHPVHGVEHIDGLGAVGHGDGDLVPLADADGAQGLGTAVDLLQHGLIGRALAHEVEGDVIRVLLRRSRPPCHTWSPRSSPDAWAGRPYTAPRAFLR